MSFLEGEEAEPKLVAQGRLIPGSSVASLPFIDAVRGKAGNGKDALPDEVFGRLRGALFLGPSWAVTRNKLKLRCFAADTSSALPNLTC